jgi:gamma-glutamylcyclotransferase (GGCT)/AIG2-like uncharacterized protein YtfP
MYHFAEGVEKGIFPYIKKGKNQVVGEVLTFDKMDEALARADILAGSPEMTIRRVASIECSDGTKELAVVYVINESFKGIKQGACITSGDWIKERSTA